MLTRGSVGWTAAVLTASFLEQQAALISNADAKEDEEFTFIISQATTYWGVRPTTLALNFGGNTETIRRWATGINAPIPEVRPLVLRWIAKDMRERAEELQASLVAPEETTTN